jgi:hypothetical protein
MFIAVECIGWSAGCPKRPLEFGLIRPKPLLRILQRKNIITGETHLPEFGVSHPEARSTDLEHLLKIG